MYLMLDTDIRSSEMFDMKLKHIDFKNRCIALPREITKSRKPRILPLFKHVLRLLMELAQEVSASFDTRARAWAYTYRGYRAAHTISTLSICSFVFYYSFILLCLSLSNRRS